MDTNPALAAGSGVNGYWPWWAGALALGVITVGYTLWTGRGLGVSGAWARVLNWRQVQQLERLDQAFGDEAALHAAIEAATLQEFGQGSGQRTYVASASGAPVSQTLNRPAPQPPSPAASRVEQRPMPLACYATLLAAIFFGGLIGAMSSGRFSFRTDMGAGFSQIVTGSPAVMVVLLFTGGLLVGFGTRMAGGCSSGHGLTGCSRMQPASILATAVFFGTAVGVSLLLWKVI
jgi:YeeE/YedE family (DUF395).